MIIQNYWVLLAFLKVDLAVEVVRVEVHFQMAKNRVQGNLFQGDLLLSKHGN